MITREEILRAANAIVNGEREGQYGSPEDNFSRIAMLWNGYLSGSITRVLTPVDVAMMMTLMKVARTVTGTGSMDTFVDIAGYAACGGELFSFEKDKKGETKNENE